MPTAPLAPLRVISSREGSALRLQQTITVLLLFAGYAAYYFCRSDLSVAMPLIIEELRRHGMGSREAVIHVGAISSFGVLAYALGKLSLTGLGDFWGGKLSFIIGLGGAAAFTALLAAGGLPLFAIAWMGNRLTQSMGWAGLIKVCSKWFGYSSYGTIIGILSLSYLVGDALARHWMGLLLDHRFGWRAVFYFAAGVASTLLLANLLFLREARVDLGYREPEINPLNVFAGSTAKPENFWALVRPLLSSYAFGIVCLLSFGCTVVRETFNIWTVTYLQDFFGYRASSAARMSAVFPAVGVASVLITGWLGDRLGPTGRATVMSGGLTLTALALMTLTSVPSTLAPIVPITLIGVVGFSLLGPYSYLGGAIALDFGGKQGGAASSGIIDGVGYLGGVLAGEAVARLSVAFGWRGVFVALATVSALSALAAVGLLLLQRTEQKRRQNALCIPGR